MSEENLEMLKEGYTRFNRENIEGLLEMLDPEVELIDSALGLDSEIHHGHEGVRTYFDRLLDAWEDFRCEPTQYDDRGEDEEGNNRIVVMCRLWGKGRGSGVEVEAPVRHDWRVREGLALRARFYWHAREPEAP
jgi:ketosteroid isomerase-like protein